MEQRPSDSQNESANELPQAQKPPLPVEPVRVDPPADAQRNSEAEAPNPLTANELVPEPVPTDLTTNELVTNDRVPTDRNQGNHPSGDRTAPGQPNQPGQPRQEKQGNDRQRDNQSRQNQGGQNTNQMPKQDRSGQPRQPNNQPRDPNQPQKQNQQREQNQPQKPTNQQARQSNASGREGRQAREPESSFRDDERDFDSRQPERIQTGSIREGGPREETGRESDNRLTIGITLGDYNGIGPEVILKALQYNRLQKVCTPVIYGSMRVLNRYRNLLEMKDWNLNGIQQVEQASHKLTNVITCWPDQNQEIQPGKVTAEAGQAAFACLQRAVEDLREGKLDAIVTAPINKHNIQSEEFKFPGHTEYLAEAFSVGDNLMFLVSERLRVGVVTGHVPLGRVRQNITRERILQKWTLMNQSLRLDFGIDKPRIAVLGLNPHAGEEGLLGNEEQEIVKPLLKQLQDKGNLVYGPFPADGFFGTRAYLKFDAVLAMYHDQGLIPFKAIAFDEGVNFTAGMPVVRTSPDHGTAYDIAGKGIAEETSMLQAIYTACDVARRRRETAEIMAGALKPKRERAV